MTNISSEIQFTIHLDDNRVPDHLTWFASDSEMKKPADCKAFMISVWDTQSEETLRIDLWTKEMRQDEMDKFFFETFMTMADTYLRANKNDDLSNKIKEFGYQFGETTGLLKRK